MWNGPRSHRPNGWDGRIGGLSMPISVLTALSPRRRVGRITTEAQP